MSRRLGALLTLIAGVASAESHIPLRDNSDISLTLSQSNYNRIVVKNDKITEAVFPPQTMAIKRDEQDGSVYVMLATSNPFTLFVSTESGRHFSVTVNGEEGLGKTIELVPQQVAPVKTAAAKPVTPTRPLPGNAVPEAILALLEHMEQKKPLADVTVSRIGGKAERWAEGLTLLPKESWDNAFLKGEIIELYNGGRKPLTLTEAWFAKEGTLAIKFSKPSMAPGEHAMLWRVQGVQHG